MKKCPYCDGCPFFGEKLYDMPNMAGSLKDLYCDDAPEDCARYQIRTTMGKGSVPPDLWPHQLDRAAEILAK